MAGPWEKYGGAPQSALPQEIVGPPKEPTPQTPAQAESDRLANELKRRQLAKEDKPQSSDNLSVNQANTAGFYARALNANKLYGEGVPPRGAVTQTLVDILPDKLVRANESDARKNAETAAAEFVASTLRKESGAAISPQEFESQYARYFPQPGDGPDQIKMKAQLREQALEAMRIGAGPEAAQVATPATGEFGPTHPAGYLPPGADKFPGELSAALKSGQIPPDPYAIIGWAKAHGGYDIPLDQAKAAADAMKQGVTPGVTDVVPSQPDIGDVRNQGAVSDTINSTVRGLGDTVTMGLLDKGVALGDTITKGGTFDQNLARQYAISDFDAQNHPIARFAGQAAGGFALPMGEVSGVGNLALKGAGYGAAYGAGSSRSLGDVPMNALLGGAAGGATAGAFGLAGKGISAMRGGAKDVPPLVDPATGELNQPMDAMSAGQRVATMRDQGFDTVTPGMAGGRSARVIEQGLNNLPGSAGVMEDVNSAASGQARRAMQNVAQKFGSSKTLNEGGSELQRGANEYINRFEQVSSKAYNAIPISDKAPASLNNTVAALQGLSGRFSSNPDLAEMANNPKFAQYLDAFQKHGLSWRDLKDFRSMVGDKIGEMRFGENDSTSDFRSLYAALSEDMRNTAASMGPQASRAFDRANTLYRQGQQRIDTALTRILGPNAKGSPEKAAQAVQAMTRGGKSTGDLKALAEVRASTVKSGAWDEIASTLIHLGGQPANSEGRAFNPATFVNWYADMSEPARQMLFKPELRKSLDQFVATSQQLARVKGMTNTSNTTPTMIGSSVIGGAGVATALGQPMALVGIVGGGIANNLMARLWTSPKFVNLITGYGKAVASGNQNAVKSQVGRFQKLAATNPELREGVELLLRKIANDNGTVSAAASDGNTQENQ